MTVKCLQTTILGFAALLAPVAVRAQEPVSGDPANNQSMAQNSSMQSGAQRNQTTNRMQDSTGTTMDDRGVRDKQFVRNAGEGGLAEVELGRLASQKSNNDGVKMFGQKMVDDHTMLNNEMKPIAESLGVMVPKHMNKMDQAEYDKLNGLSGEDFDKEYLSFMVKDHRKDLHEFRMEAVAAEDPALKDAVMKGARVIRKHLSMVEKLASENGVTVPGPARVPAGTQ